MVGVVVLTFLICWFPFALMFAGSPFSISLATFFAENRLEETITWLGMNTFTFIYNHNLITHLSSLHQLLHEPGDLCRHEHRDKERDGDLCQKDSVPGVKYS